MENPQQLKASLQQIEAPRILVIGDIMLDRYSWGKVERISPEAPIPVLRVEHEDSRLGGAANTMANLATLGAQVLACGIIGNDASGKIISNLFSEHRIDDQGILRRDDYTTILKHRMISGHTHLLRMDFDPDTKRSYPIEQSLCDYLDKLAPSLDLIVVSDYGKGLLTPTVLSHIAQLGRRFEIPVIGDPRPGSDFRIYQNFTLLKPNRKETEQAVGFILEDKDSILKAAQILKTRVGLDYLLLSLDKDGLLLYQSEEEYSFLETEAQEVFDVVGAGDMIVSVMAFMLAGGSSIEHAAYWANLAASMEIMHVGVVSFTKAELIHRFEFGHASAKVISLEQLLKQLKRRSNPIVFTNGYFDDISSGHLKFLQQLRLFKGFNIVAINSDRSIEQRKGKRPSLSEQERASLLSVIDAVDRVLIFDTPDTCDLIRQIRPTMVVKGGRYQNQSIVEQPAIEEVGAVLKYLPDY